ncbi:uncharacterized protein LOC135093396 [Scylla paramamosain]|uniref:uncharacterized protein LOC135093396 n=1 Tax=Scylla paramamosain TaxID=85552 RepID=UPI0030837A0B
MVGTKTTRTVTVEKRGMFDDDPFFKDSLEEWDKAMKTVVDKWPADSSTSKSTTTTTTTTSSRPVETRNVYRQIRSSNVTSDDSQAVSCTEENDKYKMMIDVKDYKPGDITVKTVDDTVVVEGKIEQKEGNSIKTQVFTRRFMLPPTVNLNGVTSALSRDGVLTISAPKLAAHVTSGRPTSRSVEFRSVTPSSRLRPSLGSMPAAGKPSVPNGPDRRYLAHTPLGDDGHHIVTTVVNDGKRPLVLLQRDGGEVPARDGGDDAPPLPAVLVPRAGGVRTLHRPVPRACRRQHHQGRVRGGQQRDAARGEAVGGQPRPRPAPHQPCAQREDRAEGRRRLRGGQQEAQRAGEPRRGLPRGVAARRLQENHLHQELRDQEGIQLQQQRPKGLVSPRSLFIVPRRCALTPLCAIHASTSPCPHPNPSQPTSPCLGPKLLLQ